MSPKDEYRTRLEGWTRDQAISQRRFLQTGNARLAIGVAALLIAAF